MENKEKNIINADEKNINEEVLEEVNGGFRQDSNGKPYFKKPAEKDDIHVTSGTF